jgi:predicted nucleic acid-binding protein
VPEYVTDTNSLVLHLQASMELGPEAQRVFEETEKDGKHTILIPSVVYAELITRREEWPNDLAKLWPKLKRGLFRVIPFDEAMADVLVGMTLNFVPDRIQQMAIAMAKHRDLQLITGDRQIIDCGQVGTIWDKAEVTMEVTIFLSYAREDFVAVKHISCSLREETRIAGITIRPWLDEEELSAGENWPRAIQEAIRTSDFFFLCLSKNSVKKRGFIQQEIRRAREVSERLLDEDVFLIPVMIEECEVPGSMRDIQSVDLALPDGWAKLLRSIEREKDRLREKKMGEITHL